MAARRRTAHRMDHRIVVFERIARHDMDFGVIGFCKRARLGFELRRSHVLGGRVHKVTDHQHRRSFCQRRVNPRDVLGQENARFGVLGILAVAIKAVLTGDPAVQSLARFAARAPVSSAGEDICQFGKAPRREIAHVGNARHRKPAVAIGHDRMFVSAALKLLRSKACALAGAQSLEEIRQRRLVHKVEGNGLLAAIWLDQRVSVGHVIPSNAAERGPLREEIARCAP